MRIRLNYMRLLKSLRSECKTLGPGMVATKWHFGNLVISWISIMSKVSCSRIRLLPLHCNLKIHKVYWKRNLKNYSMRPKWWKNLFTRWYEISEVSKRAKWEYFTALFWAQWPKCKVIWKKGMEQNTICWSPQAHHGLALMIDSKFSGYPHLTPSTKCMGQRSVPPAPS